MESKDILNIILIIAAVIILLYFFNSSYKCNYNNAVKESKDNKEGFNENSGQFCLSCDNKNYNQCNSCFNCGFGVDQFGNSKCVAGDYTGPYNFESFTKWYHSDPFAFMLLKNRKYKCSDGPHQMNRIIGDGPNHEIRSF